VSQYYYTVASLPYIQLESDPPFTEEIFVEMIHEQLGEADAEYVLGASLMPEEDEPAGIRALWFDFTRALRNELTRLRAQKMHWEAESMLRDEASALYSLEKLREAVNQQDPLKAEEVLFQIQWNFLDELNVGHFFDVESLTIYLLKLQILWKKQLYMKGGSEAFTAMYQELSDELASFEIGDKND
jgi:hypothetical protein